MYAAPIYPEGGFRLVWPRHGAEIAERQHRNKRHQYVEKEAQLLLWVRAIWTALRRILGAMKLQ